MEDKDLEKGSSSAASRDSQIPPDGRPSPGLEVPELSGPQDNFEKESITPKTSNGIRGIISRTISHTSTVDPGPPPDGGRKAWTQALVGHIIVLNTWGFINSFGVFQTYYVTALNRPPSDISWVGSIQIFLLFFVGAFSGRLTDAGYFKALLVVGTIFYVLGVFMTSLSTQYWQLFLAQGVCTGLGNGLLFCPSISVLSTYFTKKRALAIAIAASGTASGGTMYPAIVECLLPRIGFPWTVRVLGFVMLGFQIVAITLARTRLPPRKTGPLLELAAFKELPYLLFTIGGYRHTKSAFKESLHNF